jgi:hypothetical protein
MVVEVPQSELVVEVWSTSNYPEINHFEREKTDIYDLSGKKWIGLLKIG